MLLHLLTQLRDRLARDLAVLPRAQREFANMLADIDGAPARALQRRVAAATSLRQLWHLRAEMSTVLSGHRDPGEVDRRLARLGRHFPRCAPRTSIAPSASRHASGMAMPRTEHRTPETGR